MNPPDEMTKAERAELATVVRLRTKVGKADVDTCKAQLMAELEEQLATIYSVNDERWAEVASAASRAVEEADAEVARVCAEAGIPEQFRPRFGIGWLGRGENRMTSRRAELRKAGAARLEAEAKQAKLEWDRHEAALRADLAARGLTSDVARGWLEQLPTAEALLAPVTIEALEAGEGGTR